MYMLKQKGLLERYTSPESKNIPASIKILTVFSSDVLVSQIIGYNKHLVAPKDVPKSYEDLLLPKWKGKMSIDR